MSDETPVSPAGPDEAPTEAAEAPTDAAEAPDAAASTDEAAEAADTDAPTQGATAEAPAGEPTAAATAALAPEPRRGVFVPAWVAVVVGALLVAGLGFAIGWIAAPSDDSESSNAVAGRDLPTDNPVPPPGNGNLPGIPGRNGNGPDNDSPGNGGVSPPLARFPYLGVTLAPSAGNGSGTGATISAVAPDSPAADAGLQAGDVITAVDGDDVGGALDLVRQIRGNEPGDEITVTYTRGDRSADVEVTLESRSTTQSVS